MTLARRLGVVIAALALSILAVSPALATDVKSSQVPTTAENAPQGTTDECSSFTQDGMVLWHFVLNDHDASVPSGGWGTVTLTATFTDGNGATQTRTATDTTPVDHYIYQFDVVTPDGWTLTGASTDLGSATSELLLSHVCIGGPPPEVPEAPVAMFLPLIALFAFGGYLMKNRRRATIEG